MLILACSILFLYIKVIQSQENQPYTLLDESFTSSSFETLQGWTVQNGESDVSDCDSHRIIVSLGNFAGTTIEKTLNLPAIYELKITATVVFIDFWDKEYFRMYANDQQIYTIQDGKSTGIKLCGGSSTCEGIECATTVKEIEIIISLPLLDSLDEDDNNESWGMRDFKVWGKLCPADCGACEQYIFF